MELSNLKLHDLDLERGTIMIRQGKGFKDRMIPIGERAAAWMTKYIEESRPSLVSIDDDRTVFLSNAGDKMTLDYLTQLVSTHVDAANIGKRGACHLFRHTMATLMLEGGADIRYIQAMLGHADLKSTQIYTQVSIRHSLAGLMPSSSATRIVAVFYVVMLVRLSPSNSLAGLMPSSSATRIVADECR